MKKILSTLLIAVSALSFTLISCDKETPLTQDQIPSDIKTYVTTHFPKHTILQCMKDKDNFELTYDLILSDGISLEFNRKKETIGIDGKTELPSSVIPTKIYDYVKANYENNHITDWEITDKKNQQVELDNGIELLFDKSDNFLRIDN